MPSFKEISENLDSLLQTVALKKQTLNDANAKAAEASEDYQNTLNSVESLRQQLMDSLSEVLPHMNDNVKVMSPRNS